MQQFLIKKKSILFQKFNQTLLFLHKANIFIPKHYVIQKSGDLGIYFFLTMSIFIVGNKLKTVVRDLRKSDQTTERQIAVLLGTISQNVIIFVFIIIP